MKSNKGAFTYDFSTIYEKDMAEYFRYMINGNIEIEVLDKNTRFQLARGSFNPVATLR